MSSPTLRTSDLIHWRTSSAELIALEAEARALGLGPARPVTSVLAGSRVSRFKSRGADYLESRPYQPGDDVRQIDWRVTARSGKVHSKLYVEERERPVLLLIDLAPSLYFGSGDRLKVELAAEAAVLLAWAVATHGDRVGAVLATGSAHQELPPTGGRRGVMRLIRTLVELVPKIGADVFAAPPAELAVNSGPLAAALDRLLRVARPGALVVLISDFYDLDEAAIDRLRRLRRHQDLRALWISDPLERQPPMDVAGSLSDGRRSGWLDLHQPANQRAWRDGWQAHANALQAAMRAVGVPLLSLDTARSARDSLLPTLGARGRPRRSAGAC